MFLLVEIYLSNNRNGSCRKIRCVFALWHLSQNSGLA
jgi:hypothetical protein